MRVLWLLYFGYVCFVGYQVYRFIMSPEAESLAESAEAATALAAWVSTLVLVPYLAVSALGRVFSGSSKQATPPTDPETNVPADTSQPKPF